MAGAYVAKPDTVSPGTPDGWNPSWPFPGVSPPGYEPEYSLRLTAPSSVAIGAEASVAAVLYDHDAFRTNEPDESALAWSATIDGEALRLRIGAGDYGESAISDYIENESHFWGATPAIVFELLPEHAGKTIVLTATSVVDGESLSETANIAVGAYGLRLTTAVSGVSPMDGEEYWGTMQQSTIVGTVVPFPDNQRGWALVEWDSRGPEYCAVNETESNGAVCTEDAGTNVATVTIEELDDDTFDVTFHHYVSYCRATLTMTLELLNGETVCETHEKVVNLADDGTDEYTATWARVTGATGSVDILDP